MATQLVPRESGISIRLDPDKPSRVSPGDTITGAVDVFLVKPTRLGAITLTLEGAEHTCTWSTDSENNTTYEHARTQFLAKETCVHYADTVQDPGLFTFPFAVQLPSHFTADDLLQFEPKSKRRRNLALSRSSDLATSAGTASNGDAAKFPIPSTAVGADSRSFIAYRLVANGPKIRATISRKTMSASYPIVVVCYSDVRLTGEPSMKTIDLGNAKGQRTLSLALPGQAPWKRAHGFMGWLLKRLGAVQWQTLELPITVTCPDTIQIANPRAFPFSITFRHGHVEHDIPEFTVTNFRLFLVKETKVLTQQNSSVWTVTYQLPRDYRAVEQQLYFKKDGNGGNAAVFDAASLLDLSVPKLAELHNRRPGGVLEGVWPLLSPTYTGLAFSQNYHITWELDLRWKEGPRWRTTKTRDWNGSVRDVQVLPPPPLASRSRPNPESLPRYSPPVGNVSSLT